MGKLTPETMVWLGFLAILYGILVGGAWVRRTKEGLWDTVSTIIFTLIALLATLNLVYLGVRQRDGLQNAKQKLECVATQIAALREDVFTPNVRLPIPACDIKWEQ